MKEELTEKERHLEISLADLSERILREEVSVEAETSEATGHADLSLKMEKEDRSETDHADLSERIPRGEVSEETEVSEAEDHADHSLKMEKEDLSQAVEDLQLEDAEDSTQQRRASLEETSTISAMRTKAESTK